MILTVTPNPCVDKTLFIDVLTPGAKIRSPRATCIAGGKGCNVSRAVKAMGGETCALTLVGGVTGQHVVNMLETEDGVPCAPVWVSGMTRTITTLLEEPAHRQTALFEPGPMVSPADRKHFVEVFTANLAGATMVTFNGSAPDPELDSLYRELVTLARDAGVPAIVDAYGPIFEQALDAKPFMVKPNLEELELFLNTPLPGREEQWGAVEELLTRGVTLVVLSLGAEGALVASGNTRLVVHPPRIKEVNPVGSGDALVAGFALGLTRRWNLERTVRLGIAMGTANAMSWDIGSFTPEQVEELLPRVELRSG